MYGGTNHTNFSRIFVTGLSPRVRGNLRNRLPGDRSQGSIPACTGEPSPGIRWKTAKRVYPRVYGGTDISTPAAGSRHGLSPRVRGNLRETLDLCPVLGSIPACTGEPGWRAVLCSGLTVYPRVYGGTTVPSAARTLLTGLSPRVRGNLRVSAIVALLCRSIPACTGEPESGAQPSG